MSLEHRALDSTFRRLGKQAVLDPDGLARSVLVLPARADEIVEFRSVRAQAETGTFEVRAADFAEFGPGTLLEIGSGTEARRYRVQNAQVRDPARLKVFLDTVPI